MLESDLSHCQETLSLRFTFSLKSIKVLKTGLFLTGICNQKDFKKDKEQLSHSPCEFLNTGSVDNLASCLAWRVSTSYLPDTKLKWDVPLHLFVKIRNLVGPQTFIFFPSLRWEKRNVVEKEQLHQCLCQKSELSALALSLGHKATQKAASNQAPVSLEGDASSSRCMCLNSAEFHRIRLFKFYFQGCIYMNRGLKTLVMGMNISTTLHVQKAQEVHSCRCPQLNTLSNHIFWKSFKLQKVLSCSVAEEEGPPASPV